MTLTVSLNGLIDAVMIADGKYYVFIYRDNGNGMAYPVRHEITVVQYCEYTTSLEVAWRDGDSVTFDVEAQKMTRLEEMAADFDELQETYDGFLAGAGAW
jgi:hypothetical protein